MHATTKSVQGCGTQNCTASFTEEKGREKREREREVQKLLLHAEGGVTCGDKVPT